MSKSLTLDERIAAALMSTDITSTDLAALIVEVEAAAQAADENATKAREQALDRFSGEICPGARPIFDNRSGI
jgi:hypothetical protein